MARKVAVLVGSPRKDSFNRKMAHALADLAGPALAFDYLEIGAVPLYNQDLDNDPPAAWKQIRQRVRDADAALFVTPEYNRSVPGVLKNAIDVASRPMARIPLRESRRPFVSVSPGAVGGRARSDGAPASARGSCRS